MGNHACFHINSIETGLTLSLKHLHSTHKKQLFIPVHGQLNLYEKARTFQYSTDTGEAFFK
jgi:hypothetical protein